MTSSTSHSEKVRNRTVDANADIELEAALSRLRAVLGADDASRVFAGALRVDPTRDSREGTIEAIPFRKHDRIVIETSDQDVAADILRYAYERMNGTQRPAKAMLTTGYEGNTTAVLMDTDDYELRAAIELGGHDDLGAVEFLNGRNRSVQEILELLDTDPWSPR